MPQHLKLKLGMWHTLEQMAPCFTVEILAAKNSLLTLVASRGWGYCRVADDNPIGTDIREAYFVYENPETGAANRGHARLLSMTTTLVITQSFALPQV